MAKLLDLIEDFNKAEGALVIVRTDEENTPDERKWKLVLIGKVPYAKNGSQLVTAAQIPAPDKDCWGLEPTSKKKKAPKE